jgi:hypothetical protein
MGPAFSAEVFRRAAAHPDAPPALVRAADAALDGKFSWAEVAAGTCEDPLVLALFSPKTLLVMLPILAEVEAELAEPEPEPDPEPAEEPEPPPRKRRAPVEDDDYSEFTYLQQLDEPAEHPLWPRDRR